MHPEIEKLIDLGIVDGQITEKERKVILKKAAELGVDADEVEMTLDGRLYQLKASNPKEKVGNIKTCPACGAEKKSFSYKCICGHEYVNTKGADAVNDFNILLSKIPKTSKGATFKCNCKETYLILQANVNECYCYSCKKLWIIPKELYIEDYDKKAELITNYNMPNDKEGLLSILFHLVSIQTPKRIDIEDDPDFGVRKAAYGKIIQSIEIAKIMFADDQILKEQLILVENKVNKVDKIENWSKNSITLSSSIIVIGVLVYFGYNFNIMAFHQFVKDFNSISWKVWAAFGGFIIALLMLIFKISRNF